MFFDNEDIIEKLLSLKGLTLNNSVLPKVIDVFKKISKTKIVTVAGTNGKGTTVHLLASILSFKNITNIAHLSPHIVNPNERIRINNNDISNPFLNFLLLKTLDLVSKKKLQLNYYSIFFLCVIEAVFILKPKWLILEVGIGGRLDLANVLDADISVLTQIGIDHVNLLGNSVESISMEKVAIARKDKYMVIGSKIPKKSLDYLKSISSIVLYARRFDKFYKSKLPKESLNCGLEVFHLISPKTKPSFLPTHIFNINFIGRNQALQLSPVIIVDMAHNYSSISYLLKNIINLKKMLKKKSRLIAFFSMLSNKDIKSSTSLFGRIFDYYFIPSLKNLDPRGLSFCEIRKKCSLIEKKCFFFDNYISARNSLIKFMKKEDAIVIFGSSIIVGRFLHDYYRKKDLFRKKTN